MDERYDLYENNIEDIGISYDLNKNTDVKSFSWALGIFYILVLYGCMTYTIMGISKTEKGTLIYILVNMALFVILMIFLVIQIVEAFREAKRSNIDYFINGYLFYKYTLLPSTLFFVLVSLIIFIGGLGISLAAFVVPPMLFAVPAFLVLAFILPIVLLTVSFVVSLPGLVFAIFIISMSKKQKGMSIGGVVWHIICQMIIIVDIIDGLYILGHYWKRGKIASIVTGICASMIILATVIWVHAV